MSRYFVHRFLQAIPLLLGITAVTFQLGIGITIGALAGVRIGRMVNSLTLSLTCAGCAYRLSSAVDGSR